MSKLDKFGLIFLIASSLLIIGATLVGAKQAGDYRLKIESSKQEISILKSDNEQLKARLDESRLFNKFRQSVEEIGAIPYGPGANCYDHAKLLQKLLAEKNIASSILITPTRDHAFIGVWIEANTGSFIKPGRYEIGEVRDETLKTICQGKIIN